MLSEIDSESGRNCETDMPIERQRIWIPIAFLGLRMGLGEKTAGQITGEMARKEGCSLDFLC